MRRLSRIFKDYQESGALNALLNIHAVIDDHTFLAKSGDLVVILGVRGQDYECLDVEELDQLARVREDTLIDCPATVAEMYAYLETHYELPFESWSERVRQQLTATWSEYLKPGGLRDFVMQQRRKSVR